jgi:peptide/nickel transport system substrate-binding protein
MREPEQRITALLNGEIQIAQFVPPHLRERVANNPSTKIVPVDSLEIMFLAMSPKFKPWDNKLLRQAVAYAIDRDTIIKTILKGQATRLDGPIGQGQYGYDPGLKPKYEYNPEKARQLVQQAGFAGGVDVEFSTPVGRYTLDKQISEAIVPMLNAVGIRAKLQTPEWATLWANVQQGKVPFYYMGRGGIIDPSPALQQYFETGGSPRIGYSNPELDKLLAEERQTFDAAKRKRILSQAMSLITEDAPAHFLWRHQLMDGVSKNIDYKPRPDLRVFGLNIKVLK